MRAISWVAAPCSSTAAAMVAAISEMRPMVPPISLMAATDSWVAVCMPAIWVPISSVALAVWAASALTSWATTAKPLAGLAGARRLDGGVERQQVGLLGDRGDQLDHVADAARRLRQLVDAGVGLLAPACTASPAILLDSCTWRLISLTEEVISSVAEATDWTLAEASSEAAATTPESCWVVSAVLVSVPAAASSSVEADDTVSMMSPTAASNSSASLCIAALRRPPPPLGRGLLLGGLALLGGSLLGGGARLGLPLLGLHLLHADEIVAEGLGGAGVVADLVAALRIGDVDRLVAVGEFEQHLADGAGRDRNGAADQPGEHDAEGKPADREPKDEHCRPVDLAGDLMLDLLFVGDFARLDRLGIGGDGLGRFAHLVIEKIMDLPRIVHGLEERLVVFFCAGLDLVELPAPVRIRDLLFDLGQERLEVGERFFGCLDEGLVMAAEHFFGIEAKLHDELDGFAGENDRVGVAGLDRGFFCNCSRSMRSLVPAGSITSLVSFDLFARIAATLSKSLL